MSKQTLLLDRLILRKSSNVKLLLSVLILLVAPLIATQPAAAATTVAITSPASNATITDSAFTVSGIATANRYIEVKVNGAVVANTTSNGSGVWSVQVTGQNVGSKTVQATATGQLIYSNVLKVDDFTAHMSGINTLTNTEESSFPIIGTGEFPIVWRPNPAFTKAYGVAPFLDSGTVWAMSLVDGTVSTFTLPGSSPRGAAVAFNTDGSKVYITDNANSTVYVYNVSDNSQVGVGIPVGTTPHSNRHRPNSNQIWIANSADSTVSVIDTISDTVLHTYSTSGESNGIDFSPDGNLVYVGVIGGVDIINANTGVVTGTMVASHTPEILLANKDGSKLYASYPVEGEIDVFKLSTSTLEDTVAVANNPWAMALDSNDSHLYVAQPNMGGGLTGTDISVIDTATNTIVDTVTPGGGAPFFIYSAPDEVATASVSFSVLGEANGGSLAETGQNGYTIFLFGTSLTTASIATMIARRKYIYKAWRK